MIRLVAAFLLAAAVSLPFTNVPVIDDWIYAYTVEQLLRDGQFRILDYSCRYNLVHVLWGTLFTLPAGFSFVALRVSTVFLAVAGLAAFLDLLRQRTRDESLALWATALLAFNPVFFRLSLSFMTDVPLVAVVAISFWLFDRGLRKGMRALVVLALALSVAAYLVRELSVLIPAALIAGALFEAPRRVPLGTIAALAVLAVTGFALEYGGIRSMQGSTSGWNVRAEGLRHVLAVPLADYAGALVHMVLTVAAFAAPLLLATLRSRREMLWSVGLGSVLVIAALLTDAVPFGGKEVLSPLGLGMSRVLLPGEPVVGALGEVLRLAVCIAAALSLGVMLLELLHVARRGWRERNGIDAAWIAFGLAQTGALLVLWLWQDRYDLVLLPAVLWLAAVRAARVGWAKPVAAAGVIAFALVAVLGTRDDFELNQHAWEAEAWLRAQDVPAREIDGGYVLNGWRLYAYADEFAPGFPPADVPFLFSKAPLSYEVRTTPPPTQPLREFTWPRTWLSEARLYAARRSS